MSRPLAMPEIVSKTIFYQTENNVPSSMWHWQTKALNNEIIAEGTEGYTKLQEALVSFFEQQGERYVLGQWPVNYGPFVQLPDGKYQINKFLTQ